MILSDHGSSFRFLVILVVTCGFAASRPKHLLVFINPFGGKGHGKRIYERKVAPLFALASVTTEVIGKLYDRCLICGGEFENDLNMAISKSAYPIRLF